MGLMDFPGFSAGLVAPVKHTHSEFSVVAGLGIGGVTLTQSFNSHSGSVRG